MDPGVVGVNGAPEGLSYLPLPSVALPPGVAGL